MINSLYAAPTQHHRLANLAQPYVNRSTLGFRAVQVLCTTSTLAMGVNLPAHLVVIKGTTRYVGDTEKAPGETTGYKEYTQTEVSGGFAT